MDACWEASVRATTILYCMLMIRGVRSPAESLMFSSRWSYTGTHHLSSSFSFFQFDIHAPWLSERFMCENAEAQSSEVFFFCLFLPFFFLSAGASYARLPTPPQAQQDLLVLTMPAPQGSRVACWVPHFSTGIPANAVGLPQECFLTTASVIGTNREQREGEGERERKYSYQVGRNGGVTHSHSSKKDLSVPVKRLLLQHHGWRRPRWHNRLLSCVVFVTSHHWKCQMSWNLLMSVVTTAPAGSELWGLVFLES